MALADDLENPDPKKIHNHIQPYDEDVKLLEIRVNVGRTVLIAALVSGGIAGLAGMGEVAGIHHRLLEDISNNFGYSGIVVATLGALNPLGAGLARRSAPQAPRATRRGCPRIAPSSLSGLLARNPRAGSRRSAWPRALPRST